MYPPLPDLVPGYGKLGKRLLHLGSWEWGTQIIVSPQILIHIIEHFHQLGRDRTVPTSTPVVLPGAEGLGRGHRGLGGCEWVTQAIMSPQTLALIIEHFSIREGAESFLVRYPPFPCSWIWGVGSG